MSCSRRHFMAGMSAGALIMMTGPTRSLATTFAHSQTIDGVRYGMIHDEAACIGCTACMDACREVNQVPEGVSRLDHPLRPHRHLPRCRVPLLSQVLPALRQRALRPRLPDRRLPYPQGGWHRRRGPDLCVGCMYCLAACPYQVRFINPVTRVADKCDFCRKTNLAAGKEPACVASCPTKALVFGNLDDPDSPIAKRLVKETTYRYKQALGTSPKMYRVPKGEITS